MGRMTTRVAKATTDAKQAELEVDERRELLHNLEMKHQRNSSNTDLLVKDEDVRRLKLRILLLRDENTSLRDQIAQNDDVNTKLISQCDDLSAQIEAKMEVIRSQEQELRKQEREYKNLKAELQSMTSATQESENLLSEKLALTRELAVLKPEIEHLRSQVNQQQATLTEKLSLERQVNTLEVELANEKKAVKRAMQKRESNDRVEDELRKKLRETEKNLTAEKTARERLEDQLEQEKRTRQFALQEQDSTREVEADLRKKLQDAQKQLREEQKDKERLEGQLEAAARASQKAQKQASGGAEDELRALLKEAQNDLVVQRKETEKIRQESQVTVSEAEERSEHLEKKLEKFKTKVRELQDQLKQCQADLKKAQQARGPAPEEISTKTNGRPQAFRKKKAQDMAMDDFTQITINTPSAEDGNRARRMFKKRPIEPSAVGEKSTFSITPFLNRSKTGSDDAPEQDDEEVEDSILGPRQKSKTPEVATAASEVVPAEGADTEPTTALAAEDDKPKSKRGRPKKILGDAPSAKKNAQPSAAAKKTVKASKPSLEKVSEEAAEAEDSNEEEDPSKKLQDAAEKTKTIKFDVAQNEASAAPSINGEQPKKKKRKVLGSTKTLFAEEEGEEAPAPVVVRKQGKVQLGGGAKGLSKAPLAARRAMFAAGAGASTFSPLKRDRRGVGASFLA
ncbi:hypothetical protein DL764_008383 [Monosporascus ibericus]|uniref:Uncharacterized protein n=1 Tax=Monosporascus ibericus TaxID=155417 RepID=A0A4Q4T122_9PEZI|nr:hypothetical protein DL764_008383 [Monosporascus ibericus]